jgi:hypothetical protein
MTISEIRARMRARGSHWWDLSSMTFFGTGVESEVIEGSGGIYFVTSEKPPVGDAPRRYSVRRFDPERCAIDTVGDFCGHDTLSSAVRAAACAAYT